MTAELRDLAPLGWDKTKPVPVLYFYRVRPTAFHILNAYNEMAGGWIL